MPVILLVKIKNKQYSPLNTMSMEMTFSAVDSAWSSGVAFVHFLLRAVSFYGFRQKYRCKYIPDTAILMRILNHPYTSSPEQ